jgi:hypothetical protein
MKRSPLYEPESPSGDQPSRPRWIGLVDRWAQRLPGTGASTEPEYEPVSDEALTLGRFIANQGDLGRTRLMQVAVGTTSSPHKRDELPEYLYSEIDARKQRLRPRVALHLIGQRPGNSFECGLDVFDLNDGSRLVQASGPWYTSDYVAWRGMVAAVGELFGKNTPQAREVEHHSVIDLGLIHTEGAFTAIRPFNEQAFGLKIVPVLDRLSAGLEADLRFQIIQNERIVQD